MALAESLTHMESAGLVRLALPAPELEYVFRHALVHEAAYGSLLRQDRRLLHARIGEALEHAHQQPADGAAALLAYHFWNAGVWDKAADYALRAGEAALKVSAPREAMDHYGRALEALKQSPGAPSEQVFDALLGWARAAHRIRPYAEQLERLGEAERLARDLNDPRRLAHVLYTIGTVHLASGHATLAGPVLAECFALADQLEDERLRIIPTYAMGMMAMDAEPRPALGFFERTAGLARAHGDVEMVAYALGAKAVVLARLGESEQAARDLDAAFEAVKTANSASARADVDLYAGWAFLEMGDVPRGLEYGRRGVDGALAVDYAECACHGYACVGFGHLRVSQLAEAGAAFGETIRRSRIHGAQLIENEGQAGMAMTRLQAGDPGAAQEAEQALNEAEQIGSPLIAAMLQVALAEAYASQGDRARALQVLGQAIDYYSRSGLRPYLARARQTEEAILAQTGPSANRDGAGESCRD